MLHTPRITKLPRFAALIALAALILTGCGEAGSNAPATSPQAPAANDSGSASPTPVVVAVPKLASSELVTGPERFVFGLVNSKTGLPIKDVPVVGVQFLKVHEDGTATKVSDGVASYHNDNLPAGLFVVQTNFDAAGKWGALITIRRMGQEAYQVPLNFDVVEHGAAPKIGDPAPPSKNLIESDVKSHAEICSARPFDDMHSMTIADAVKSGKPTLILFGTPGYCESSACGPDLEVAKALEQKYPGKANFIHIETPSVPAAPQAQAPTVKEWNLASEPWIYMVDSHGVIARRFEGGMTMEELEPAFQELLKPAGE